MKTRDLITLLLLEKQLEDRSDQELEKYLQSIVQQSQSGESQSNDDASQNTKQDIYDKRIRFILHKYENEEHYVLLVNMKKFGMFISPKVRLNTHYTCTSESDLIRKLFYFGYKYYEIFFGVKIVGCCLTKPFLFNDVYTYVLTNKHWKVRDLVPDRLVRKVMTDTIQWNVTRAMFDKNYARSFVLGDETLTVIKELIRRRVIKI